MRKCKIDDHARNGVRVSQYSKFILLGALAFLFLAIVTLCVFSNLNALATDNIAFADEEQIRTIVPSYGYVPDNYIPNSFIADRVGTSIADGSSYSTSLTISEDDYIRFSFNGVLSNNILTGTYARLWIYFKQDFVVPRRYSIFAMRNSGSSISPQMGIQFFNSDNNTTSTLTTIFSISGNSYTSTYHDVGAGFTYKSGSYYLFYNATNLIFDWISFTSNSNTGFSGYVNPDYKYYGYNEGYNEGYADGVADGSSGFPVDTGFVGTNLMPNSFCLDYTYDSHINTTSDRYYSDSDWVYTYGYGTGQYSLVNNVLTNVSANYVALKYEGSLSSGDYTFTLGFISSYSYDVEVDVYNSITFDTYGEHVEKYENEAPYWISSSFTIPNSNMRSSGTPVTIIVTCFLDNNTSINLNYIKLETGSVFTGYALDENGDYQDGYDDGLAEGYTTGYDDGVTQATVDFDYIVWSSTVNTSSGLVANIDQPEFNPNTYDNSSVFIRVYSVDNQAHTYVDPVTCAFYITFDNTLSTGFVIYIDFNFNVDFTGSQKIGYTFAPLDTGYNSDEAWGFRDGVFDNNTSGIMLVVPRTSNRLYFSFGVTETKGVSGAGGLPLYYLYSFSVSGDNKILANSVGANSDIVEDAYNRGKEDGFLLGQIDGQNNNPYSFKSLFSSIYDVPVGAFNNMFNFDVFGVNFRTFLLAMISLALGLFIWKVIVRGG